MVGESLMPRQWLIRLPSQRMCLVCPLSKLISQHATGTRSGVNGVTGDTQDQFHHGVMSAKRVSVTESTAKSKSSSFVNNSQRVMSAEEMAGSCHQHPVSRPSSPTRKAYRDTSSNPSHRTSTGFMVTGTSRVKRQSIELS